MMETVLKGGQVSYEALYHNTHGRDMWFHINAKPVQDDQGSIFGICLSLNNITMRKEAEMMVSQVNESLERKVKERTAELENVNKELESFSYSISHDLRAPLRIINGFAKMLLKREAEKLDSDAKEYLDVIMDNAIHMGQLIDDLLNFSRMGNTPLNKTEVEMQSLVQGIADDMLASDPQTKAQIKIGKVRTAECDYNLMKQVWINLLSNAIKYSRKKEKPMIEIGSMRKDGHIVYYVKDNGAGFNMEHYDKLFSVFQRLHKVSEYEGTGVGLALSQRIITRHGGRIWAEATVDKGATFYFSLPPQV
jgi:light-regulated signal transduction histidine kinase (bacteriophytochrome)